MIDPADRELDAAIARLVANAGADAPEPPTSDEFDAPMNAPVSGSSDARRLVLVGVTMLIVIAVAGVVLVARPDDEGTTVRPIESSPVVTDQGSDTVPLGPAPPPSTPVGTVASPTSETPTSVAAGVGVTRPVVDASICAPVSAREGFTNGLTLFGRPSNNPVPIQIIADRVQGPTGPFAVVQRYFGDDRTPAGDEAVEIAETTFWVRISDNGSAEAQWDAGDGSLGNVTSHGLDRSELLGLLEGLVPRDAAAPIPGFDYTATTGTRELLLEELNTDLDGQVSSSECDAPGTGYRYRITAISGDPIFQYGGVIDRPAPLEVGTRNGTLIIVDGVDDPTAPRVVEIVDADLATWLQLQSPTGGPDESVPRTEPISEGVDVVVPLESVDGSTDSSFLTFRLSTRQGVTALEVHTANAVLAPDAAFWRTYIDGGSTRGGMSTASIGPVAGFPIGDEPLTQPFDVTVQVVDGGEFVLQTTGPIRLVPG